ncbi:MAG: capsular polysaccharide biosynthesis protein [Pseudomonadota bacterium]
MIRVFSRGIRRIPHLEAFLGAPVRSGIRHKPQEIDAVAGWGLRRSARRARRFAERHGLPCYALEDGFLRSVYPGPKDPPLALVMDDLGIYYDASRPSRLEKLISEPLTPEETARAHALIRSWRRDRVSKYNHLRELEEALPAPYVLVVDQTLGDASISHGEADAHSFQRMLHAALADHPDCTVVIKVHPDVSAKRRRGHFDIDRISRMARVAVLGEHAHPAGLIEQARAVYTVTSQVGFEGLIHDKPVHTFGVPFYAGWGLTHDAAPTPKRRGRASLEQLLLAALVKYARYVHPETGERCEVEDVVEHLALQRRMRERFPRQLYAVGFSPYKRPLVRQFCQGSDVKFIRRAAQAPADGTLVLWGSRDADAAAAVRDVVHLEDGFLRSVGLGADLVRPISWAMDRRGIYYDPSRPSDLEHMLETREFTTDELARARQLRQRIVAENLTKYNVGDRNEKWKHAEGNRPIILVPGQVEDDAAVRFGCPNVRSNAELLKSIRKERPDAHIIYKPHPDVVAGLRRGGTDEHETGKWCDELVTDVSMGELLNAVDEVHTLTSLAGFEMLLRGKPVTCHGQPFYSGWGLTADHTSISRRTRAVTVDELVAGALLLYPTYISRTTQHFTTPERAITELLAWREFHSVSPPLWRKLVRVALRWQLP